MLFNSAVFMAFMVIFTPLYALFRRDVRARNILLILASYVFYGWWDWRFLVLVAVSTSVDYLAAMGAAGREVSRRDFAKSAAFLVAVAIGATLLARSDVWILAAVVLGVAVYGGLFVIISTRAPETRRRAWLALSLVTNFGILGFFKYFGFFVETASPLFQALGMGVSTLHVVLPVGLSFYTFQAVSRTIDSYRGVFSPQPDIVNYAAFHAFFPQLVAGPIERAGHLMPQFERVLRLDPAMIDSGLRLFLLGLAKKMIVADNLAPIVEKVFAHPSGHPPTDHAAAILAFTLQIYCDFSGYSDMARGIARCLGFDLMINFARPYFAASPSEFWRRWHISLSSWLRDYVYIPLGGNRKGALRTHANLMATMLIGGLWHGASWTFVAWGGVHGTILILFRASGLDRLVETKGRLRVPARILGWGMTMAAVVLAWILFRSPDFGTALTILLGAFDGGWSFDAFVPILIYAAPLAAIEAVQYAQERRAWAMPTPLFLRFNCTLLLVGAIMCFAAYTPQQFIYFDF